VPFVPAVGTPLNTFVAALNVTPLGSAPISVSIGVGEPIVVTVNDPTTPTVNVVVFAVVMVGATPAPVPFRVTL
jgi:hypothetical protein